MGRMTHYSGDFFHVFDYLQGSAFNYLTMQRAVDAAHAYGGGTVFCPPGVYDFGGQVVGRSNVRIEGCGASATLFRDSSTATSMFYLPGRDSVSFSGVGFERSDPAAQHCILNSGSSRLRINDCVFGGGGYGVYNVGGSDVTIAGCEFATRLGVVLRFDVAGAKIGNNVFRDWWSGGAVRITGSNDEQLHSSNVEIVGNRLSDPYEGGGAGSVGYPIHSEGSGGVHREVTVADNWIRGTDREFGSDAGTPDQISMVYVDGLMVKDNWSFDGGDMGITIEHSRNVSLVGNHCFNNDVAGIWVDADNVSLVGNVCVGNGVDRAGNVAAQYKVPVYITGGASNVVEVGTVS